MGPFAGLQWRVQVRSFLYMRMEPSLPKLNRTWGSMRRYIISYDLYRPGNNYSDLTTKIKRLGEDWEHPIANLWIVETKLTAGEIRSILGDHLVTGDKLYIREVGEDVAGMDIGPGSPAKMTAISTHERAPVKLLANVLSQSSPSPESHLLTAAIGESW